jgi:hypothetical protein
MRTFVIGQEYKLREVMDQLRGEMMSFLPVHAGRIVCGRFRKAPYNANAPYEVLVANHPKVRNHAERLVAQGGVIPVFVKEGLNRWRFHGPMKLDRYETDPRKVKSAPGVDKHPHSIYGVLYFRDAK